MSFTVISILWGVGWAAKNDLDDPFRQLRSPPSPESFGVRLDMSERQIDAYRMLLGLKIVNLSDVHLNDRCFVKIIETDLGEAVTSMLPSEIALRTENQVRRGQKGQSRFTLSMGELKTVPVLFCEPHRRIDWFFLDENGKRFAFPVGKGRKVNVLVGVFGGEPHVALITLEAGENWTAMASIKRVPNDFSLKKEAG
jgi:hypothetical protein